MGLHIIARGCRAAATPGAHNPGPHPGLDRVPPVRDSMESAVSPIAAPPDHRGIVMDLLVMLLLTLVGGAGFLGLVYWAVYNSIAWLLSFTGHHDDPPTPAVVLPDVGGYFNPRRPATAPDSIREGPGP